MRECQAPGFIPESGKLFFAKGLNGHQIGRLVNIFSIEKDGNQEFLHGIGARSQQGLFPCFNGIEQKKGFFWIKDLILQADQVGNNFMLLFVINPIDGFVAGIGDFLGILRQLDFGHKGRGTRLLHGGQLIDTAKGRTIPGGDKARSYAPGIDFGSLHFQRVDEVFIQIIGGTD